MNIDTANKIFTTYGLPIPKVITKINVGFTNDVYNVDNKYILKICKDTSNEPNFSNEVILYGYFNKILPVPELIKYDSSKLVYKYDFMIYKIIKGDNLYNTWHTLSDEERINIVKQLCDMLKIINNTDVNNIRKFDKADSYIDWQNFLIDKINKNLQKLLNRNIINEKFAEKITNYLALNKYTLEEQKLALVYWDVHFDNILIKDNKIVGLLDFERTNIVSLDFVLDTVKRMVRYPKKYMSEYAEQFARKKDYANLLNFYKYFYPEIFNFKYLEIRLNIYEIDHNLQDLINWPEEKQLVNDINKIINN